MIHDNGVVDAILLILILIPSVILHEVAHGWVANRLGDPTARDAGRLTLDPLRHIDPFGSLLLPGMLALAGQNVFGWAKPVPVQPRNFQSPVGGMAITALAGPATNLLIAFGFARFGPFQDMGEFIRLTSPGLLPSFLFGVVVVNVALAVFNMLPIPPLDGSRLVPLVLPPEGRRIFDQISQFGFLILVVLLFVFEGALAFLGDWIRWLVFLLV